VRDPFRHAPNAATVIAASLILPRHPWDAHGVILCSAESALNGAVSASRREVRHARSGPDPWPGLGLDDDQALAFTNPMGTPLRHSNFYRRVWMPAVAKAGLPGIHFCDLRHAGNTFTADEGASLRELMERMGHSTRDPLLGRYV